MLFRYGKFTVDNLIHLVLDSPHDLQPTLWYICEFHSWRNSENWPVTRLKSPSSSERDAATATKKDLSLLQEEKQHQQLIQREKTIAQKEKDFEQKEKNLAQKETLLQQKLLRAELREREALEFEQEAKIKLEEVDEKEQELEAEKLALQKNKIENKNKNKGTTSSIPTHDGDDDDNPTTNETNNNNDNQWLLRFSNLQQRLETAYREIENLRRPVSPAGTKTTNITTTATATTNGDNDNENEKSSSIITSLQHELKLTKGNAQKLKEENIFLWEKLKNIDERNVSSLTTSKMDLDNLVDNLDEASSVGNRWAPLNFRVERRGRGDSSAMMSTATGRRREGEEEEEGIVGMIEMQKEFKFLGRLR